MSSAPSEKPSEEQYAQVIRGHIRSRSLIDTAEFVAEVLSAANEKSADSDVSAYTQDTPGIRPDTPRLPYARRLTYATKGENRTSAEAFTGTTDSDGKTQSTVPSNVKPTTDPETCTPSQKQPQ